MSESLQSDVRKMPGIGEKKAETLRKLGIETVGDLLRHFPRAYQDRGSVRPLSMTKDGEICSVLVTVASDPVTSPQLKGHVVITKMRVFDCTASATVLFFNQAYIRTVYHVGDALRIWGKIRRKARAIEISSPSVEPVLPDTVLPDLTPVYPLTAGLTQKGLYNTVGIALTWAKTDPPEPILPEEIRLAHGFPTLYEAYEGIHRPADMEEMERARAYFVYEQLYLFSLGLEIRGTTRRAGDPPRMTRPHFGKFLSAIPYELTGAQKNCIVEIGRDLCAPEGTPPMARLVSGDVGSGKTIVAAAAIWICLENGYQAALMAPTEILASQHYADLSKLFASLGYETALLTGSTPAAEKRRIKAGLQSGTIPFVIGTHALLTPDVRFKNRGLVVTDEQHRFGVGQRSKLSEGSEGEKDPHVLVMSATPIPRTLSLILYGDLDVSVIDEMPPGRQKVDTFVVGEAYRARLNAFIRKQVAEGGQVYIVCPSIEAEEKSDDPDEGGELIPIFGMREELPPLHSAVEYARTLSEEIFPDIPVACLHGKMKPKEKDEIMRRFAEGEIRILVSTTVIEVGVNVPAATLMIVENADRFGLSQLHQLRGRVGRGKAKAYCVLVSDAKGENAKARLEAMRTTSSGFKIAEQDLALRGPGDFFPSADGTVRQSGSFSMGLAAMCSDMEALRQASEDAKKTVGADPTLSLPGNLAAREAMEKLFRLNEGGRN